MIWHYFAGHCLNFICGHFHYKTDKLKRYCTYYSQIVLYISSHSHKWIRQRLWGTCIYSISGGIRYWSRSLYRNIWIIHWCIQSMEFNNLHKHLTCFILFIDNLSLQSNKIFIRVLVCSSLTLQQNRP